MIYWDTNGLQNVIATLKKQKEELVENRDFLINLRKDANVYWQSLSGELFDERLDIDIKKFDSIIVVVEDNISALSQMLERCYKKCEEETLAKMRSI